MSTLQAIGLACSLIAITLSVGMPMLTKLQNLIETAYVFVLALWAFDENGEAK